MQMPSPFPGMDPYLEHPDIFPDFHDRFAEHISAELNRTLPAPYYARQEMRPEVGIIGEEIQRRIVPDVSVQRSPWPTSTSMSGSVAVLDGPRTEASSSVEITVPSEPIRHHFVEVRDSQRAHVLVTLIEIVSPSNKRSGVDRQAYEAKQQEVLHSDASLVEVDLLRTGRPVAGGAYVIESANKLEPAPDYIVVVSRAWKRVARLGHQVFAFALRDLLPCITTPLREDEAEVPLDLQYVFNLAYDGGPYRRGAVDYTAPPDPPLLPEDLAWADELLREKGLRS